MSDMTLEQQITSLKWHTKNLKETIKSLVAMSAPKTGRLGAYANTIVSDLDIDNKGQYFRDLFGKYHLEVLEVVYPTNTAIEGE